MCTGHIQRIKQESKLQRVINNTKFYGINNDGKR